jgi:hypothetical protein
MMGRSNERQKANMSAMNTELFYDLVDKGLHHQYMKNTLQLNTGMGSFVEIGELAGITYTDWSWSPLLMDMDNDGFNDLFVTNGMRRNVNDNDFNALFRIQKAYGKVDPGQYIDWLSRMPVSPVENFAFRNQGDLTFETRPMDYGLGVEGFSNGAAYADLDGDLDLVVNHLDAKSQIFENRIDSQEGSNFLRLKLNGRNGNRFGLGAGVRIYSQNGNRYAELHTTRGYESSVEPILHFGLGDTDKIDSLHIFWPTGGRQAVYDVEANQSLEVDQNENRKAFANDETGFQRFIMSRPELDPVFVHTENEYNDFDREVLLPHKMSQFGPALAVADVNGDGLDDFYVGGALGFPGKLYVQDVTGSFNATDEQLWRTDATYEDVSAVFFDANGDGSKDLYVVSDGNERPSGDPAYQDRLYLNDGHGNFRKAISALPRLTSSGSCVRPRDFDGDGDLDLFIGGRQVPGKYPMPADSYLLQNESHSGKTIFVDVTAEVAPELFELGMVTDASWADMDGDSRQDLILVGEWMAPKIFKNGQQGFTDISLEFGLGSQTGWWNCIETADIDQDGDLDLIAGNLGLNYKYKASEEEPFKIFADDFDKSGSLDIVLGYYDQGELYPLRGRECSSQQIPSIKKKFPNYTAFSKATLTEVYPTEDLTTATKYEATTFANSVFVNESGTFRQIPLPNFAQTSSINAISVADFNSDGRLDLLTAGNLYGSEVETPRNDASMGLVLLGNGQGNFEVLRPVESGVRLLGETRALLPIKTAHENNAILVARNGREIMQLHYSDNP